MFSIAIADWSLRRHGNCRNACRSDDRGILRHRKARRATGPRFMMRLLLAAAVAVLALPATGAAERLSVTSPVANIRSGPGTDFGVLWQIAQYHPIEIIKKTGPWYQFKDYQGDTGYIHSSLVGSAETVITAKDTCNVRAGPGTQYPVVFSVGDGIPFKVIEKKHNWLRIEHADGDGGWIYRSLVW